MSDAASMLSGGGATTTTTAATTTDPAATTAATTTTADPTTTTTATTTTATPPDWTSSLDEDAKKFIETKGFKSPADALKALRESAPPETADAYELPVPQGEDPAFAKAVAPIFHKAGLSAAQAKAIAEGWNEMQTAQRAAAQQAEEAKARENEALTTREKDEIKREWGTAYDANVEHMRRAWAQGAAAAGIPADKLTPAIDALEQVVGFKGVVKLMAFYGQHFAEDQAHGLGGKPSPTVAAAARIYDKSNMNP